MANSCLLATLQNVTLVLATLDALVYGIFLVIISLGFLINAFRLNHEELMHGITGSREIQTLTFVAFLGVLCILEITLAAYLFRAANNNNLQRCKKWLIFEIIFFFLGNVATNCFDLWWHGIPTGIELVVRASLLVYSLALIILVSFFMLSIKQVRRASIPALGDWIWDGTERGKTEVVTETRT